MQSAKDKKKAEKEAKRLVAEEKKRQKELEYQKTLVDKFNEKQGRAGGAGSTIQKLKVWLDEPPYKMTDVVMQMECFYQVAACLQALKPDEIEAMMQTEPGESKEGALDVHEAVALNKYLLAGMQMLTKGDAKVKTMISYPLLLKAQLRLNQTFGQALVLKSAFEKGDPIAMINK